MTKLNQTFLKFVIKFSLLPKNIVKLLRLLSTLFV